MSLLTFKEFKRGPAKRIAGVCVGGEDFRDYTNEATRVIMRRGSFWATVQPMQGCVYDGCIVWPRQVGAVLAMNVCGRPLQVANFWYQFMPWDSGSQCLYENFRQRPSGQFTDTDGTLPVFRQIPAGHQFYVRFYINNPNDQGKTITLYGLDGNGQVIRTRRADGTWQDGIVLSLARDFVQTPFLVSRVDRILKNITSGNVRGYMADANGVLLDMSLYAPNETNPEYIRNRLRNHRHNPACPLTNIEALIKLAFIPVFYDDDMVLIENQEALAYMIMSIRYKEQGDAQKALQFEQLAFHELNLEMRERFPNEQFVVSFQPFGEQASFNRITAGFM